MLYLVAAAAKLLLLYQEKFVVTAASSRPKTNLLHASGAEMKEAESFATLRPHDSSVR